MLDGSWVSDGKWLLDGSWVLYLSPDSLLLDGGILDGVVVDGSWYWMIV